jgi:hypothetical protein
MSSSILIRLGGLAAMVGGVIYAVSASLVGRGGGHPPMVPRLVPGEHDGGHSRFALPA